MDGRKEEEKGKERRNGTGEGAVYKREGKVVVKGSRQGRTGSECCYGRYQARVMPS